MALELPVEVGGGGVAALMRDLLHGLIGLGEQAGGAGDAQFVEVLGDGATGALLEQPAEGAFAQAGQRGELGNVEGLAEVRLDVSDDVADAVGGLRVRRRMEAGRGDLLELVGAGREFEEFDQQRQASEPVGLGHLVQEHGGLLARGAAELQAQAGAFEQAADGGDGGMLGPLFAEEIRAELHQDPFDAGLAALAVVTEVVGQVGAEEQDLPHLERRHLVADPAFGAAA